ncbi:MAG: ABC transporter substrate-binding protein [Actinomycetota bacterium]|nr:ABC transporter substrate-binding protein [Actinomycetota bacterium]
MTRTSRTWQLAAAASAAALVLAACGEDEPTTDGAGDEPTASEETSEPAGGADCSGIPKKDSDDTLTVGTILPQTGSLAFLGPPEFAGVELAVNEVNDAGGVLGKDVELFQGDSGDDTTNIASQTYQRLQGNDVDAMVGAASSAVSLLVIDEITGDGVMQVSPANTSDELSTYDDNCLYFRTAPPDVLQGRVLADLIAADGNSTLGIMALQDAYGTGLANNTEKFFTESGGEVVEKLVYDPKTPNFATEVSQIKAQDPDAIALVSFDETKKIIPELVTQGIGPADKAIYFVDGNLADYSDEDPEKPGAQPAFPEGTLEGVKGTLPGAQAEGDFRDRLIEVDPKLNEFAYAPEAYDATVLIALAATSAESDVPADFQDDMIEASEGGTKCTEVAECLDLLEQGEDIDYDGVSGPVEFLDNGDPGQAVVGIYQYAADNSYSFLAEREGTIG